MVFISKIEDRRVPMFTLYPCRFLLDSPLTLDYNGHVKFHRYLELNRSVSLLSLPLTFSAISSPPSKFHLGRYQFLLESHLTNPFAISLHTRCATHVFMRLMYSHIISWLAASGARSATVLAYRLPCIFERMIYGSAIFTR